MTEIKEAFEEEKKESELDGLIEYTTENRLTFLGQQDVKQKIIDLAKRKVDECYDSLFFNPFTVQEVKRYAKQKLDEM